MQDQLGSFVGWEKLATNTSCPALMVVFTRATDNRTPKGDMLQKMYLEEGTDKYVAYSGNYAAGVADGSSVDAGMFTASDKRKFKDAFNFHPEKRRAQEQSLRSQQPSVVTRVLTAIGRHR